MTTGDGGPAAFDLRRLPKVELHCHVEGTLAPAFARELAKREGADISDLLDGERYRWNGFAGFLAAYDRAAALLTRPDDYRRLVADYLRGLAADGALYAEIFVSPDHARRAGLAPEAYLDALSEGIEEAERETGIVARMIVVGVRHFGPDSVEAAARIAVSPRHPLVSGFGLAGDERVGRPADFGRAFDIARDGGLGLTAHAGEFCGPEAIAETLDALKPRRLGHGVRAIVDRGLLRRIVEEGVVLEVCPTSNLSLGVFPDAASHPLRALAEAGCRIALGSDDPPFFETSLAAEYAFAAGRGFDASRLLALTRTAIEAAFLDAQTRGRLQDRFLKAALALGAPAARQ